MINSRLAKQSEKIDAIAEITTRLDTKSYQEMTNEQWSTVVKRKPSKSVKQPSQSTSTALIATGPGHGVSENGETQQDSGEPAHRKSKRPKTAARARPPAILLKAGNEEFPSLVKKIRGNVNRDIIGEHVVGMRQTKSEELLIEIKGDSKRVEAVRAEVINTILTY